MFFNKVSKEKKNSRALTIMKITDFFFNCESTD